MSDFKETHTDSVSITTTAQNMAPVADAGLDIPAIEGDQVELDGSGSSDPDSSVVLTYSWTQKSGANVILSDATAEKPTFTAPAAPDTLTFELVVNDGFLDSAPSTVTVMVMDFTARPNCSNAHSNIKDDLLWAPDGNFSRAIRVQGLLQENGGENKELSVKVTSVTQDEDPLGLGASDEEPDAVIRNASFNEADYDTQALKDQVLLRKQRDDAADGRVYIINFMATNVVSGLSCNGTVRMCAPIKKRERVNRRWESGKCINSGQGYSTDRPVQ